MVGFTFASGNAWGLYEAQEVRQHCPTKGSFDGHTWRFFNLEGDYKSFVVEGPKPVVHQEAPVGYLDEYELDMFAFDAKCKPLEGNPSASGAGWGNPERLKVSKPARYVAVVYFHGPYLNIPFTLTAS